MTQLTVLQLKNAKPKAKTYKLYDEKGLSITITTAGSKSYNVKYYFQNKPYSMWLGTFPETSLQEARERRDEVRRKVQAGINPVEERKEAKRKQEKQGETFEVIAREWHNRKKARWHDNGLQILRSLTSHVFPVFGSMPIAQVTKKDVLDFIRRLEDADKVETAKRLRQRVKEIFQYAVGTDRMEHNPAAAIDLAVLKEPEQKSHFATISKEELPEFLEKVKAYDGDEQTRLALQLLLLTFVRSKELYAAEWKEFDFERKVWNIPAERMKKRRPHFVPLSTQALQVLVRLKELAGDSPYVFPAQNRRKRRPYMSANTMLFAIYRMGYHSRMTGHGVRALASTILNENGFNPDAIERQLAHVETNEVRAAYNRGAYIEERTGMMQSWGNYLDGLLAGEKVIRVNFLQQKAVA